MRHPITLDLGATLRFGVKPYTVENDVKTYLTDQDISMVFKIRNGEHAYITTVDAEYTADGLFEIHLPPETTAEYYRHRAYYYILDAVYASGDVMRWLEGPVYVRPVGGRSGY